MCEDSQKSFSTSLVMYTLMAKSIAGTMQDVLNEPEWCNGHKALSLSFLRQVAIPIVDAIKLYGDTVADMQLDDSTILREAIDSLATLTEVGAKAKALLIKTAEEAENDPMIKLFDSLVKEGELGPKQNIMDILEQLGDQREEEDEETKLKDLEEGLDKLMGGGLHGG